MVLLTEDCLAYLGNWKTESAPPVSKANEQTNCILNGTHCGSGGLGETSIITSSLFSSYEGVAFHVTDLQGDVSSVSSSSKRIER